MAGFAALREGGRFDALPILLWKAVKLILTVAVTFLGLLLVTFLISHVVSVDPVLAVVGDRASKATYDKMYIEMGLDKPLWEQFWIYLQKVVTGDFGKSFLTKKLIVEDIARVFPATLELATVAILIGTLVGVPLGVLTAVKAGSLTDQVVRVLGLVGYSAPIFWLGLLGLLVFYANLGWVSGPGRIDPVGRQERPDARRSADGGLDAGRGGRVAPHRSSGRVHRRSGRGDDGERNGLAAAFRAAGPSFGAGCERYRRHRTRAAPDRRRVGLCGAAAADLAPSKRRGHRSGHRTV